MKVWLRGYEAFHSPLECLQRLNATSSMLHVESSIASFLMFIYSLIIDPVLAVGSMCPVLFEINIIAGFLVIYPDSFFLPIFFKFYLVAGQQAMECP
jgi:hypothetical protein